MKENNRKSGCWTCLNSITLRKGLTRVEFYKGIDLTGAIRYLINTSTYVGGYPSISDTSKEVTKDEGNQMFCQLKAEGYIQYFQHGVAC